MLTSVRAARVIAPIAGLLLAAAVIASLGKHQARPTDNASPSSVRYSITDLGNDGGRFAVVGALSINNRGQVVCEALWIGGAGTFLWQKGKFTELGGPTVRISPGRSLNDRGQVVGSYTAPDGRRETHVVIFRGGKMVDTGVLGHGLGIDERGRVVGDAPHGRAFLYDRGRTIDLGGLGGARTAAYQINVQGQIAGASELASGEPHAFLYSNGKMQDLGTLGGKRSLGTAINSKGWIAGFSQRADGQDRAFLYRNGKLEELGGSPDGEFPAPHAINATGSVVGESEPYHEDGIAILWTGGRAYDLQDLIPPDSGWTLFDATSINDRGQITVEGYRAGGRGVQSCVLTPVKNSGHGLAVDWWRRLF
ncbi:MAG TPA: hypothetical protein VFJ58_17675 [Armatimonadota bacterium]|nr:hypothetical protein [Armatimonadota bacterium]